MLKKGQKKDMVNVNDKKNKLNKRVATLYRVSMKSQLDDDEIPMQQRACRSFIEKQDGWKLVKEYTEKGVSGFKVSIANRDVIQQARQDAEKGLFDVLLVFMFDRLGRIEDETPYVLEWFVNQGIEMWSVLEGQQKIEQISDRLMNYLRFWQSSNESRKTSERVNEKHTQMVEDGIFRGGSIPYGYKGVDSGNVNKRGKSLINLVVDIEEALVVKKIYELVHDEGYGQLRIAKYLNENNIPAKKAIKWGAATINVILKNPIYKGVMRYRNVDTQTFSPVLPDLVIINTEVWERVQEIRKKRNPKVYSSDDNNQMNTRGSLLFIGLARCGCCKSRLTTTTFVNKYKTADGQIVKYNHNKSYRCSGKLQGKTECTGQSTFSANKLEKSILKRIDYYIENLKEIDISNQIEIFKKKIVNIDQKQIKINQENIEQSYVELSILNAEVPNSLCGKSSFKPELLNNLIEEKNNEIEVLNSKLAKLEQVVNTKNIELKEMELLKEYIPYWKKSFYKVSTEKKKNILGILVENIFVSKQEITINLKLNIRKLFGELYI
ncbi:recombinase family protein [Paenibacillus sp. EC2-1]|uniref:recombinase family protein n=1 Tax=Paenibacillus sp. EC2-1 TaxID=3388665 RepID=UPI003BEEEA5F